MSSEQIEVTSGFFQTLVYQKFREDTRSPEVRRNYYLRISTLLPKVTSRISIFSHPLFPSSELALCRKIDPRSPLQIVHKRSLAFIWFCIHFSSTPTTSPNCRQQSVDIKDRTWVNHVADKMRWEYLLEDRVCPSRNYKFCTQVMSSTKKKSFNRCLVNPLFRPILWHRALVCFQHS